MRMAISLNDPTGGCSDRASERRARSDTHIARIRPARLAGAFCVLASVGERKSAKTSLWPSVSQRGPMGGPQSLVVVLTGSSERRTDLIGRTPIVAMPSDEHGAGPARLHADIFPFSECRRLWGHLRPSVAQCGRKTQVFGEWRQDKPKTLRTSSACRQCLA
jgi:hypothetical protein